DLAPLRPLLTEAPDAALPARAVVHEFEIHEEAQPEEAVPIIVSPPNVAGLPPGPIVVRRTVGPGAVTLVGLDLGSQALVGRGLPDADVLWHRILGRRGELLSMPELEA